MSRTFNPAQEKMTYKMKQQKPRIPQLRFPEFSGEWEEKKLGEVATINPSNRELPDNFVYVDLESVEKGILKQKKRISKENAPSRAQRLLQKGDILYQTVRPYQKNNFFFNEDGDYVASTGYAQIRTKDNPQFLYQYLHTTKFVNKVLARCTGTSYPAINSNDLKTIKISIPKRDEQHKIAKFLSIVDNWIDNLKKQKEKWEEYKKGLMQQFFPAKGESVPTLRFPEFNGEWEEKKVGEVFDEITRGYVLAVKDMKQERDDEYKYPVYSSQTKNDGLVGYYKKYLYENAITWTTDGANAGQTTYRKGKFYCTNVSGVLISKKGFANKMVAEMINLVSRKYVSYVGNPKLMNNVMAIVKIKLPSLPEQRKIAKFLNTVDQIIESKQKQIDQAETWKKGLMQRMFV